MLVDIEEIKILITDRRVNCTTTLDIALTFSSHEIAPNLCPRNAMSGYFPIYIKSCVCVHTCAYAQA